MFQVFALVAGRNIELLAQQIQEFDPEVAVVEDAADVDRLASCFQIREIPNYCSGSGGTDPDCRSRAKPTL